MSSTKHICGLLLSLVLLASFITNAKDTHIFNFQQLPFKSQLSQQKIQTLLKNGAIEAILAIPTYITLSVDGRLISGIAPASTKVILVPNDDDDYYTIIPIIGGANVSQQQRTVNFKSSPHIQLIWYLRNDQYDAVYTLVSLE